MLSLNQTYQDRRLIRILVAPVGYNSLFGEQFQIVSELKDIPFYDLSRPSPNQISPFKYIDWNNGVLLFDYLRYDRASIGPGDLDDFQSSKRISMIMGLVNYSEIFSEGKTLSEEIEFFARRYNHIKIKRIFIFNYDFDTTHSTPTSDLKLLPSLRNDPECLSILPPNLICEGGVSMWSLHFKETMCQTALRIFNMFEMEMISCEDGKNKNCLPLDLALNTVYDDRDDLFTNLASVTNNNSSLSGNTSMSINANSSVSMNNPNNLQSLRSNSTIINKNKSYKKRPIGRIRKWMGDLSMQVCSPIDAVENYVISISESRSLGDSLWLAGALDGYASAIILLKEMNLNLEDIIGKDLKTIQPNNRIIDQEDDEEILEMEKVYLLAEERANEAIAIYGRSVMLRILEVECTLRLACMFEKANYFYDKERKVVEYTMRAAVVPGLNTHQQVECMIEGGLICYRLGLYRKYALFLYITTLMTAENGSFDLAMALIQQVCQQIGTGDLFQTPSDESTPQTSSSVSNEVWSSIKLMVLNSGVTLASEKQNYQALAIFLTQLLTLIRDKEERQRCLKEIFVLYNRRLLGLDKASSNRTQQQQQYRAQIMNNTNNPNMTSPLTEESLRRLQYNQNPTTGSLKSDYPSRTKSIATNSVTFDPMVNMTMNGTFHKSKSTAELDHSRHPIVGHHMRSQSTSEPVGNIPSITPVSPINSGKSVDNNNNNNNEDFLSNHFNDFTSTIKSGFRNLSVANLPDKLNGLVDKAHSVLPIRTTPQKKRLTNSHESLTNRSEKKKSSGTSLLDNLDILFSPDNDVMIPTGYFLADIEMARDILRIVKQFSSSSIIPIPQQEAAINLLTDISIKIDDQITLPLPISLVMLRPIEQPHPHRPMLVQLPSLTTIKKKYQSFVQECQIIQHGESSSPKASNEPIKKSAFFYDPFQAKRDKLLASQINAVIWSVGDISCIQVIVSNPLSVAIPLQQIVPMLSSNEGVMTYPIDVEVPAKDPAFMFTLPLKCLHPMTIKILGLKVQYGSIVHNLPIDETGFAIQTMNCPPNHMSKLKTLVSTTVSSQKDLMLVPTNTIKSIASDGIRILHLNRHTKHKGSIVLSLLPGEIHHERLEFEFTFPSNLSKQSLHDLLIDFQIIYKETNQINTDNTNNNESTTIKNKKDLSSNSSSTNNNNNNLNNNNNNTNTTNTINNTSSNMTSSTIILQDFSYLSWLNNNNTNNTNNITTNNNIITTSNTIKNKTQTMLRSYQIIKVRNKEHGYHTKPSSTTSLFDETLCETKQTKQDKDYDDQITLICELEFYQPHQSMLPINGSTKIDLEVEVVVLPKQHVQAINMLKKYDLTKEQELQTTIPSNSTVITPTSAIITTLSDEEKQFIVNKLASFVSQELYSKKTFLSFELISSNSMNSFPTNYSSTQNNTLNNSNTTLNSNNNNNSKDSSRFSYNLDGCWVENFELIQPNHPHILSLLVPQTNKPNIQLMNHHIHPNNNSNNNNNNNLLNEDPTDEIKHNSFYDALNQSLINHSTPHNNTNNNSNNNNNNNMDSNSLDQMLIRDLRWLPHQLTSSSSSASSPVSNSEPSTPISPSSDYEDIHYTINLQIRNQTNQKLLIGTNISTLKQYIFDHFDAYISSTFYSTQTRPKSTHKHIYKNNSQTNYSQNNLDDSFVDGHHQQTNFPIHIISPNSIENISFQLSENMEIRSYPIYWLYLPSDQHSIYANLYEQQVSIEQFDSLFRYGHLLYTDTTSLLTLCSTLNSSSNTNNNYSINLENNLFKPMINDWEVDLGFSSYGIMQKILQIIPPIHMNILVPMISTKQTNNLPYKQPQHHHQYNTTSVRLIPPKYFLSIHQPIHLMVDLLMSSIIQTTTTSSSISASSSSSSSQTIFYPLELFCSLRSLEECFPENNNNKNNNNNNKSSFSSSMRFLITGKLNCRYLLTSDQSRHIRHRIDVLFLQPGHYIFSAFIRLIPNPDLMIDQGEVWWTNPIQVTRLSVQ